MNRRTWQILTLAVGLMAVAVYWFQGQEPQGGQAHLRLAKEPATDAARRDLLCRTWQWTQTLDQYRGGTTMRPAEGEGYQLTFHTDGVYEREEADHQETGLWQLGPAGERLALISGARATHEVVRKSDFRHEIRLLNTDSLALAWQGRHGYVTELYLAQPDPASAPKSTSPSTR